MLYYLDSGTGRSGPYHHQFSPLTLYLANLFFPFSLLSSLPRFSRQQSPVNIDPARLYNRFGTLSYALYLLAFAVKYSIREWMSGL
jgi:hypothetical protein